MRNHTSPPSQSPPQDEVASLTAFVRAIVTQPGRPLPEVLSASERLATGWLSGERRLAIYRQAFEGRLVAAARDTIMRRLADYLGDDACNALLAAYYRQRPPQHRDMAVTMTAFPHFMAAHPDPKAYALATLCLLHWQLLTGQDPAPAPGQEDAVGFPKAPAPGQEDAVGFPKAPAPGQEDAAGFPKAPAPGQEDAAGFPKAPAPAQEEAARSAPSFLGEEHDDLTCLILRGCAVFMESDQDMDLFALWQGESSAKSGRQGILFLKHDAVTIDVFRVLPVLYPMARTLADGKSLGDALDALAASSSLPIVLPEFMTALASCSAFCRPADPS